MTAVARRCATRRQVAVLAVTVLVGAPVALSPTASAAPGAVSSAVQPRNQTLEETRLREAEAAGDLEDSSRQVQAAAAALRTVAEQLPGAQQAVARARGELAGAQAKLAASRAAVERAERARVAAQGRVDAAGEKVQEGRDDVGELARRSYQRGRIGGLQDVMEAGEPQDVLQRATMLRSVFRYQDGTLERLTQDRLALARVEADLAADEREVQALKLVAEQGEARAKAIAVQAEAAAAKVAQLVASQRAALAVAEANRAQDEQDYQAAQAASREVAERIRLVAAAAEARRQAEAAARERAAAAARAQAKAAGRPAPPAAAPAASGARTGTMLWPAPGRLTSRFGNRVHPLFGSTRFHAGLDIGGGMGAKVSAADGGTVIAAGPASGYGTLVVVSHGTVDGRDLSTAYAHMGTISVRSGQDVSRGQQLGTIGNEGNSTGPHLHFEVRRNGDPVDPLDYVSPP
ncbi:MAG: peptidase [Frankiales bacterium]|nr:peptidase [Frankiales bacterium]